MKDFGLDMNELVLRHSQTVPYTNKHGKKRRPKSCEVVLLHCMDYRFHHEVGQFVYKRYGKFFNLCKKGGAMFLVDEATRDSVIHSIEVAIKKNPIKRIVLEVHRDCAATGGSEAFATKAEEKFYLMGQLLYAGMTVRDLFPDVEIVLLFVGWKKIRIFSLEPCC